MASPARYIEAMKMCSTNARLASILATIGAMVIGGSHAAGQTREELLAWVESSRPKKLEPSALHGMVFKYHREFYYIPPESEMKTLREAVAGRPEHPERVRLDRYERRLREGTLNDPTEFWCIDKDRWRMVDDVTEIEIRGGGKFYMDAAVGPDRGWMLNSQGDLRVMDADAKSGPDGPAAMQERGDALFMFEVLAGSPLGAIGAALGEMEVRIETGGRWTITQRAQRAGLARTIAGRWERGAGVVETAMVTYPPEFPQASTTYRYGPMVHCAAIGRDVYEHVVMSATPPAIHIFDPEVIVAFDSIEPIPPGTDLDALVAVPSEGGIDPFRGKIALRTVTMSPGAKAISVQTAPAPAGVGAGWPKWIVGVAVGVAVLSIISALLIWRGRSA